MERRKEQCKLDVKCASLKVREEFQSDCRGEGMDD